MLRQFANFNHTTGTFEEGSFCLLIHKQYNQGKESMVMVDSYHGKVISTFEKNFYDDSDFYAVVWDEETQTAKTIQFATTRAWSYPCDAIVDATPEVLEKFNNWKEQNKKKWDAYELECERFIPAVGKEARSKTTKGKAKGLTGTITWVGDSNYGGKSIKIGSTFVAADRIELWDEKTETWVKPADYSYTFNKWVVSETLLPRPE